MLIWGIILGGLLAAGAQPTYTLERWVFTPLGDSPEEAGIELSYTLGEPVTRTATSFSGTLTVTQGFQQPDELGNHTVYIDGPLLAELSYEVFPNPSPDRIFVRLSSDRVLKVRLMVYDLRGRETPVAPQDLQVSSQPQQAVLDLTPVADGIYLLAILHEDGRLMKTFRIERLH